MHASRKMKEVFFPILPTLAPANSLAITCKTTERLTGGEETEWLRTLGPGQATSVSFLGAPFASDIPDLGHRSQQPRSTIEHRPRATTEAACLLARGIEKDSLARQKMCGKTTLPQSLPQNARLCPTHASEAKWGARPPPLPGLMKASTSCRVELETLLPPHNPRGEPASHQTMRPSHCLQARNCTIAQW